MILIAVLLLFVGCIEQSSNNHVDPLKLELNSSYYNNVLSYWEKMVDDRNYSYKAYERYQGKETKVDVNVTRDNFNIVYDMYGDQSLVYYLYKNNEQEYYCVKVFNYLNCTNDKDIFKLIYRNYGAELLFNYIFNKTVLEDEKKYIENLLSVNSTLKKINDTFTIYLNFQNMGIEEATKLGYSISELGKYISSEISFQMDRGNYMINTTLVTMDGNITRDIQVNISLNIENIGAFPIGNIERYYRVDARKMLDMMSLLVTVKAGYYKEEDVYRLAVSKDLPELCLLTNKPKTCISFYVTMTNRSEACKLVGEDC